MTSCKTFVVVVVIVVLVVVRQDVPRGPAEYKGAENDSYGS